MVVVQAFQGEPKSLNRAFQTLEQIGRHQCLQASLAVRLLQLPFATFHLRVVQVFIFFEPTGQDVADRGVNGELEQRELFKDLIKAHDIRAAGQWRME